MTFAFLEREAALPYCAPGTEPAAIANPLSEKYAVLRPSLLPGLIDSCVHNRRRGRKDIRLFETGSRFSTADGEGRAGAAVWCGAADDPHWSSETRAADFFDIKGVVERVCATFGVSPDFSEARHDFLAPGRAAEAHVSRAGTRLPIAVLGQLVPTVATARGFPSAEELYVAELDLGALFSIAAGSWHYPFVSAANAGLDRRVRSLHGQGRSGRAGQSVAAAHLPRARPHAHRRRGADRDGRDRLRAPDRAWRGAALTG
jgi:phenylalanyl-tRNA synthetase beta chain